MTPESGPAPPAARRSLVRRLSLWIGLSTALSLTAFALVAYMVVVTQETDEGDQPDPDVISAEARAEVGDAMLIATPVALLLAVLGAVVIVRRTIRPLEDVVVATGRMTSRNLNERLPVPRNDDEIQAVVLALNRLLARLESGFAALGRFAAEASHELRTPLTVIATELEVMLQQRRSPEDWEQSARTCLDEVHQVSRLVEALLALSRAQGGAEPSAEPVGVQALLTRVVTDLTPRARQRGVALREVQCREVSAERAFVSGDTLALASALSNIVENALQYTPSGGEVVISWGPGSGTGLVVRVDDSGPGVEPDEVERIFEPFVRGRAGQATATGTHGGCGLGLTIARRVLELHHARISVGRSPRNGARFEIEF